VLVREPGGDTTLPLLALVTASAVTAQTTDEILSFVVDTAVEAKRDRSVYEDALAEALLAALNPKELLRGVEVIPLDGHGRRRREVWRCGGLVLAYESTNRDIRWLQILPGRDTEELLAALGNYIEQAEASAEVQVRRYAG
jgi:hypothetical protein